MVVVLVFGLPFWAKDPRFDEPVPVQVVSAEEIDLEELARERPLIEETPEPVEEEAPPPPPEEPEVEESPPEPVEPPEPEVAETPPPPPEPPQPEPEPVPEQAEPLPEPEPSPPEPEPEQQELAEAPPLPPTKPTPPPPRELPPEPSEVTETPETPANPFASVLQTIERLKQETAQQQPPPEQTQQAARPPAQRAVRGPQLNEREKASVVQQIGRCWNVPVGAKDAENLDVELFIAMNPDGTPARVEIVDQRRLANDGFFRRAAESARRAVLTCSPLNLPRNKYDHWQNMQLNFNPRDMVLGR